MYTKSISLHARWMARNFSITAAAITIRFYSILELGNTPFFFMIYIALVHPALVEIYLQKESDCDIVWAGEVLVAAVVACSRVLQWFQGGESDSNSDCDSSGSGSGNTEKAAKSDADASQSAKVAP